MAKKVRDAMTVEPRSAEPRFSLAEAVQLMKSEKRRIAAGRRRRPPRRCAPVVEEDRLVAIVAQADIAHEVKAKQAGVAVEEISKPAGVES